MAKKFNNGQTFGEIRQILNDNADEINANKTVAETAAEMVQVLANGETAGRVAGSIVDQSGLTPAQLLNSGIIQYKDGKGVPVVVRLTPGANLKGTEITSSDKGVLWVLVGQYVNAWKTTTINGLAFIAGGKIAAFDFDTSEVWMLKNSTWTQASGGGGNSVVTLLPQLVQAQGGLDVALEVKPSAVVTYILPSYKYTGGWYDIKFPSNSIHVELAETSAVVTVYPNGMKTAIVSGFGEDGSQVFNGTCTYTPATGWALACNWPRRILNPLVSNKEAANLPEPQGNDNGKEVNDTNGK